MSSRAARRRRAEQAAVAQQEAARAAARDDELSSDGELADDELDRADRDRGRERVEPAVAPARDLDSGESWPAILTSGLTKAYGEMPALEPLDLSVEAGQSVALIGHNGSGKSTFLRMVAGLLEPTEGEIEIAGWPVGSEPARATTSYIGDEPVLYDDLSVREHVEFVSRLHGGDGWDSYADDVVAWLGLADRVDELPSRFSRGLRQKTSLVLGLVRPFSLLVIDEPFVGLDMAGRSALLELLDEVHRDGAAVVVATHEPSFVERVERCIALRDGEVVFDGKATTANVLELVTG